jgi:hypothetical protein
VSSGQKVHRFHYASPNSHPATIAPYRIVHYNGFWYLIGKEEGSDIIKRYALDKLRAESAEGPTGTSRTILRAPREQCQHLVRRERNGGDQANKGGRLLPGVVDLPDPGDST